MKIGEYVTPEGLLFSNMGDLGTYLVIDSANLNAVIEYIKKHDSVKLYFNWQLGCQERNLGFLEGLELSIRGLMIVVESIDLSGIEKFVNLEALHFFDGQASGIPLNKFRRLKYCAITWNKYYSKIEFPAGIEHLNIRNYDSNIGFSEYSLKNLSSISHLVLFQPKIINLSILLSCPKINIFNLSYANTLKDISHIVSLSNNLYRLELISCKNIEDFNYIGELKKLQSLVISKCKLISNINFICKINTLNHFSFLGTVVDNGDFSCLKRVEKVYFENKKHYSLKAEDFRAQNNREN